MATTTVSLVVGDCLAASLMKARGFCREDFARFHPGGSLGKRLLTKVDDLMRTSLPVVSETDLMSQALSVMIETNLGLVLAVDENNILKGLVSDGDIKRLIANDADFMRTEVRNVMRMNPVTVGRFEMAETALRIMETGQRLITVLPVIDGGRVVGVLRMHDILQAKIRA
jgi:arabinose-5-phosphate isomerase